MSMKTINANYLLEELFEETCRQSGHEDRKGQLSMSWLWLPEEDIVQRVIKGQSVSNADKLKFYHGTLNERGIRERLEVICQEKNLRWIAPRVLSAYDGKLTGHTDGAIEDTLIEIKTVPSLQALYSVSDQFVKMKRLPFKVYSQIQAYMLWGKYKQAMCIYEERATGVLWVCEIFPNRNFHDDLKKKVERILKVLDCE